MREGNGVRQLIGIELLPIRSLIIAIVDDVDEPFYAALDPGESP